MRDLTSLARTARSSPGPIVILTGAGISAESGIPTFRGEEGYWTIGSRHYQPEELATHDAFLRMPNDIWAWYLYRRDVCRAALPNPAHEALVALERTLGDRFVLVTQNVDGLHLRAGNTRERTWQIHGNIDYLRCAEGCTPLLDPVPDTLGAWPKDRRVGAAEEAILRCARCGGRARPHVLWFDESYDEEHYRWDSSIRAAREAAMLVIVGTSGATNLPLRLATIVSSRGLPLVVVNADESPFSELAAHTPAGLFLRGRAGTLVPEVVRALAS